MRLRRRCACVQVLAASKRTQTRPRARTRHRAIIASLGRGVQMCGPEQPPLMPNHSSSCTAAHVPLRHGASPILATSGPDAERRRPWRSAAACLLALSSLCVDVHRIWHEPACGAAMGAGARVCRAGGGERCMVPRARQCVLPLCLHHAWHRCLRMHVVTRMRRVCV